MTLRQDRIKLKHQQLYQVYGYNIFADAGTFNGLVCGVSTLAVLSDSRSFRGFSSSNNANNAAQFNFELPMSYIAGSDIELELHFTYSSASPGDVRWGAGLRHANASQEFNGDTYSEYKETTFVGAAHVAFEVEAVEFTFDGSGFAPGDLISVIMYRDTTAANPDTLGVSTYVNQASLYSI